MAVASLQDPRTPGPSALSEPPRGAPEAPAAEPRSLENGKGKGGKAIGQLSLWHVCQGLLMLPGPSHGLGNVGRLAERSRKSSWR